MLAIHHQPTPTMHFHASTSRPSSPAEQHGTTVTPTLKAAMAANLGSSLFLFQGLETISPYLFSEAALQPSSRSASPTLSPASSRQSFETTTSGGKAAASKNRKSWFGSSTPKPATPACESFLLSLRCTTCARRNARLSATTGGRHEAVSCTTESDFNFAGGRYAFLDRSGSASGAKFKYACNMEERLLELDLCDFANYAAVARTKEVLKRHMGDPYMAAEQGTWSELRPVNVVSMMEALAAQGVVVQEPRVKAEEERYYW